VKYSKWMNGTGDVVREYQKACEKLGMKFGVYLSPWDRNNANYAKPEYQQVFQGQIKELATNYGPFFHFWFDGANGGSGYYGGANETRTINSDTYYQWYVSCGLVREFQPLSAIFQGKPDACRGVRWIGNEAGNSEEHEYARSDGYDNARKGKYWLPAEADTSIRPGWFYHKNEDSRVSTAESLFKTYLNTVGRGAIFNLNIPPNTSGLVSDADIAQLNRLGDILNKTFSTNYLQGGSATASSTKNAPQPQFSPNNVLLKDMETFWATE
jgi:alpha-L-fucosidase